MQSDNFPQIKLDINENDYIVFLACILRKNDVNSISNKLNGLTYSNNEIEDIQFLNIWILDLSHYK